MTETADQILARIERALVRAGWRGGSPMGWLAWENAKAWAAKHRNSAAGHTRRAPKPRAVDDERLCIDAARQFLRERGQDRIDRAVRAVAHVLDNYDYDHEYAVGRDKAALVVKLGLALIGKSYEWPERAYPKNRKPKLPPTR